MSDAVVDIPPEPPTDHLAPQLAVVIPFPLDRRVAAETDARRRHPSARRR